MRLALANIFVASHCTILQRYAERDVMANLRERFGHSRFV